MFKEWQRDFSFIPEPDLIDPEERIPLSIEVFGRLCLLLSKLFPNEEVKSVMKDLLEEFQGRRLLIYFDFSSSARLHLVKGSAGHGVALPIDFPEQVKVDSVSEMQKIVRLASLVRDNYLDSCFDNRPLLGLRAEALEADFLHSVLELARDENQEIKLSLAQNEVMKKFPNGVTSLPQPIREDITSMFDWAFYKENRQN